MKHLYLFLFILIIAGCKQKQESYKFLFQNPEASTEVRIDNLISHLTLEEKASMMLYNSPAVERLGIQEYNWWNECLHGVARAGKATVFPQAIGMAATFDEDLVFRVADAISTEARAKHHAAIKKGNRAQYLGLSFWTPNINIFRDPRWGRGQETYGEDPYLTSILGGAFVKGLQGDHPKYLKTAACAKHFVVHSGPEKIRHYFNAIPNERDFRETYLPGFQYLVQEARVEAVMCAYNRTYDEPCCGSEYLLNDILRKEWSFEGHIVSDCWALDDIWLRHKVVSERVDAAAMAVKSGVNLNCGYIYKYLPKAVDTGLIDEKIVDEALKPLLRTRFKLGLFDPDDLNPYAAIKPDVVNCEKHKQLAYEAAAKSIVLLKNKNHALPLNKETLKNLLILGPTATDVTVLLGNYNGFSGELTTFLEGIVNKVDVGTIVEYNQGFIFHNDTLFHGFWQASRADVVVVCIGINSLYEGEEGDAMLNPDGGDRIEIELPENQIKYVRMVRERIKDKPLIVVITSGSAMAIPEIDEMADAVLFAWYPGEEGGNALADILFGDVNPSGRLPVTFYKSTNDLPPFDDYRMEGQTYKYFRGEPLYPFGFGLSYSEFEYSNQMGNLENGKLNLTVTVKNSGEFAGEEVVQVYARKIDPNISQPIKKLISFKRIKLGKKEEKIIQITMGFGLLSYWDVEQQKYLVESGEYEIQVTKSSNDARLREKIIIEK
ncbi:MAG: glycoside hydrolase family 3 C-terminal domain-containing protein [Bacteroidales bacterium]|nr:glycoside hydrolase family 3 C-terminal domain-containing protein [Bacteroidales bacterium]